MIFNNPSGAPELACDACGCRWFDRMTNACYECGEPVPASEVDAFERALDEWRKRFGAAESRSRRTG
jgi:hypothetical protein